MSTTETFKGVAPPIPRPPTPDLPDEPPEPAPSIEELDVSNFEQYEPEVIPLTEDEQRERRIILRQLFAYRRDFPNEISAQRSAISDAVDISSMDQLRALRDDCEYLVSSSQSITGSRNIFLAGVNVAEILARKTPLKLDGITNVCRASDELTTVINELSIKYQTEVVLSPEQRLGLIMVSLASQVHQINKEKEKNGELPQEAPIETPQESSKDKESKRESLMQGL